MEVIQTKEVEDRRAQLDLLTERNIVTSIEVFESGNLKTATVQTPSGRLIRVSFSLLTEIVT